MTAGNLMNYNYAEFEKSWDTSAGPIVTRSGLNTTLFVPSADRLLKWKSRISTPHDEVTDTHQQTLLHNLVCGHT